MVKDKPVPPKPEWVLVTDADVQKMLGAIMRMKRWNLERLAKIIGSRTLNRYIQGDQDGARIKTILDAVNGMGFEIVVRQKSQPGMQQRLALLRARVDQGASVEETVEQMKDLTAGTDFEDEVASELDKLMDAVREQVGKEKCADVNPVTGELCIKDRHKIGKCRNMLLNTGPDFREWWKADSTQS